MELSPEPSAEKSTIETPKNDTDNDSATNNKTAAGSRFFSRIGSIGDNATATMILSRAQRLRDQAVSEVDRLRHQQEANDTSTATEKDTDVESIKDDQQGDLINNTEDATVKTNDEPTHENEDKTTVGTPKRSNANETPKKHNMSPLRNAFNVVRTTGTDAAKNLIFSPTAFGLREDDCGDLTSSDNKTEDDRDFDQGSESLTSNFSPAVESVDSSLPPLSPVSTPVKLLNSLGEFRTVGRYSKSNEPLQHPITVHDPKEAAQMTSQQHGSTPTEKRKWAKQMSASPVVGGADRVVGLRFVNWDKVVGPLNERTEVSSNSSSPTVTMDKSLHSSLEPTDDDTATVSTNLDVTDAGSTITSATASEEGKPFRNNTPAIPKSVKDRTLTAVSYYEDVVRSTLKPGQRAMFFGQGVLGIVMKPTYLASWRGVDGHNLLSATTSAKKGGVYIDSMVRGSQAYLSGVVHIGDHILKVGTVDVSCMTLEEVVDVIANAKRPNIIILTAVHEIELATGEEIEGENEKRFSSSLDLVYGYVNKVATEGESSLALFDYGDDEVSKDTIEEEVLFGAETAKEEQANEADMKREGNESKSNEAPVETVTVSVSESSSDDAIDTLLFYASRRTNGHCIAPQAAQKLTVILERVALSNSDFRNALRLSLVECCSDPRRTKFLKRFFSRFESRKEAEEKKRNEKGFQSISNALRRGNSGKTISSSHIQQQLLELYLDLLQFHDATLICPESDRERLLIRAKNIFERFLDFDGTLHNDSALPRFVVDAALGGLEQVVVVRKAIEDEDYFFDCEDGDAFSSIRASLEAFLSLQESYLGFLISDDCARMRAYLRGSAPFIQVDPMVFLTSTAGTNAPSQNFLLHAILHLVCMKEADKNDDIDCVKNDAIMLNSGDRKKGAVSILSCAIFIARTLEISSKAVVEGLIEDGMTGEISNAPLYSKLIEDYQYFWEVFLAPAGGSLSSSSLSKDVHDSLNVVRRILVSSVDQVSEKSESLESTDASVARTLTSIELTSSVHGLKDALFREYAMSIYPIFRRHIFHEWLCQEAKQKRFDKNAFSIDKYSIASSYNGMKKGSIKRLLRQIELPKGVSLHRPSPKYSADQADNQNQASTVALIFGTDTLTNTDSGMCTLKTGGDEALRRFAAVPLQPGEASKSGLLPKCIPPVFESYAIAPPFHERPFLGTITDEKSDRISADGWEVSLTNFVLPSGSSGLDDNEWMYCVSLVCRKPRVSVQLKQNRKFFSEQEIEIECIKRLVPGEASSSSIPDNSFDFQSPIVDVDSDDGRIRTMIVPSEPLEFNRKLQEHHWSQSFESSSDIVVGLALVSDRNQTFRMRETLAIFYRDFCRRNICQPLVDILGNFSNSCVEESCLNSILEPYLSYTDTKWVDNPIDDQELYSEISGAQLMQSLPPVPLALLFITCLLEQKIVLASSRRGMLMSASNALMQLLKPLQWKHLLVPLVTESMMDDLVHYPAPFILGIPTDQRKSGKILSSLPEDVTLVDLDVGRVMLASEFVCDGASESKEEGRVTEALRSQALFLAESLGGIIGRAIDDSWASDSPLHTIPYENGNRVKNFDSVSSICHDFVSELLVGVQSCCLWIEERHDEEASNQSEPAIVFDEERFLSIKHLRAEGLNSSLFQGKRVESSGTSFCLSSDKFGFILDTFLRTQSLSNYISHGEKESMMFW